MICTNHHLLSPTCQNHKKTTPIQFQSWEDIRSRRLQRRLLQRLQQSFRLDGGFRSETQTWEIVSSHGAKICGCKLSKSAGADGKVYVFGSCNGLSYEPRTGRWERLSWDMDYGWVWHSYCAIDEGVFKWYDGKVGIWRVLKGVNGLPKIPRYIARMADYGGKMVVLWERVVAYKEKVILCAVIALERRDDEEIWGKVEWYDTVLTVPNKSCRVECALGVTF